MYDSEPAFCGRRLRWYEWLAGLLMMGLVCGVRAESVYRCDGDGGVSYQAIPCAPGSGERRVALDPAPPPAPSPAYALPPAPRSAPRDTHVRPARESEPLSYQCRASDGEIFYRHNGCPHSLPGAAGAHGKTAKIAVSATAMPRSQACAEMHRAGAIGRNGRQHDEDVSTYERNLGHDPCK